MGITYKCPKCGEQTVEPSGFNGNPFCWGKCYRYFKWDEIDTSTRVEVKK